MLDDDHVVINGVQRGLYVVVSRPQYAVEIRRGHSYAASIRFVQDFQCLLNATLCVAEQVKEYPAGQFHLGCIRVALIQRGAAVDAAALKGEAQAVEWGDLPPVVGVEQARGAGTGSKRPGCTQRCCPGYR